MKTHTLACLLMLLILTGCATGAPQSPVVRVNPLLDIRNTEFLQMRFGEWQFVTDRYQYPCPVLVDPKEYFASHMPDEAPPLVRDLSKLEHEEGHMIPMCGHLTEIAVLDESMTWRALVSVNADGETIVIRDHPISPTNGIVAKSAEIANRVFSLMADMRPDVVTNLMALNPCVRDRFAILWTEIQKVNQPSEEDRR